MDRSRRQGTNGARPATAPPASSRLTVRKHKNRRRPGSAWSRLPKPAEIADACGRALRRSLPAVAVVVALCAVGSGFWGGYRWLTSSPRFAITAIAIEGAHRIDVDQLRAELPVRIGDNVFADLPAIARVVRSNPWIAAAQVHRILPHTIKIELREHVAAAVVMLGEPYLAEPSGRLFKRVELDVDTDGLPIITGIDRATYTADRAAGERTVRDAIAAAAGWRTGARPTVREVHVDAHGAVTLHTHDQAIAIQLGALGDGLGARMRRFDAAWAGLSETERARARAVHLDVRPDHVTVAFAQN